MKLSALLSAGLTFAAVANLSAAPDVSKLPPAARTEGVTFDKDIKPLFEASCIRCHGNERPKAGLKLNSRDGVLKGTKDGDKVVIPGKSSESQLVISVARIDDETAMPPKGRGGRRGPGGSVGAPSGGGNGQPGHAPEGAAPGRQGQGRGPMGPPPKPLTPEQVGLVRAWIDQGAK